MPRTGRAARFESPENVKPNSRKLKNKMVLEFLKKVEDDVMKKSNDIDEDYLLFKFRNGLNQIVAEIPTADLGKTLKELNLESEKSHNEATLFANSTPMSAIRNPILSSRRTDDASTEIRSRRRSKSQTTIARAKLGRPARSLSRTKILRPLPVNHNHIIPKTARTNVLPIVGIITPKMKSNAPSVVLRRPRQGEVAVSMEGSPLMVSNVAVDQMANVNIPLRNGRIVTIQPKLGIRKSELPDLDLETLSQIKTLRDNLNQVCKMH